MSVFQADCPHCGTKSVAFSIVHERCAVKNSERSWDTLAICGRCTRGVLASFVTPSPESPIKWLQSRNSNSLQKPRISPSRPSTRAPQHSPENVAEFYRQGMDNMPGNWDAAGIDV